MADTSISLTGAVGCVAVTPRFDFSGTVKVYIDDVYKEDLTSGITANIPLSEGEVIKYVCSDWDSIVRLDIHDDKVSGDISSWILPSSMLYFYVYGTSVFGDISSGSLSDSLRYLLIYDTSVSYDSSAGAFTGVTNSLFRINFDNCNLTQIQVDNVLADLVASNIEGKTLDIGDNNASPSWTGWENRAILGARGWTVKINSYAFTYLGLSCHGWWPMNENAADKFVVDFSAESNHGTAQRNTEDMHVVGKLDGAFALSVGVPDYINFGNMRNFGSNMDDVTVTVWLKTDYALAAPVMTALNVGDGTQLLVHINADKDNTDAQGKITCILTDQNSDKLQFTADYDTGISDGSQHFLVVIFQKSAGTGKIYIDNVEKAKTYDIQGTNTDFTNFDNSLYIGRNVGAGQHLTAHVDVAGIFVKALSEEELNYLWKGGRGIEGLDFVNCHLIYRGQDGNMNYDTIQAVMEREALQVAIPNQALPANTIWHYIRRQVSGCGLESDDSPACVVIIDENGEMIGNTPNPPQSLTIEGLSGGRLKLRWRYTPIREEITPTAFKIYMDSGEGFDFGSPVATVSYGLGGFGEFVWTSDALTHGQRYRFCVRSYRADAGESSNTNFVATIADSEGPDAIVDLQASWKEI